MSRNSFALALAVAVGSAVSGPADERAVLSAARTAVAGQVRSPTK